MYVFLCVVIFRTVFRKAQTCLTRQVSGHRSRWGEAPRHIGHARVGGAPPCPAPSRGLLNGGDVAGMSGPRWACYFSPRQPVLSPSVPPNMRYHMLHQLTRSNYYIRGTTTTVPELSPQGICQSSVMALLAARAKHGVDYSSYFSGMKRSNFCEESGSISKRSAASDHWTRYSLTTSCTDPSGPQ